MLTKIVKLFRRYQRPVAWTIFGLSIVAFFTIMSGIWAVHDPVTAGLGALLLVWEGYSAVQEVEPAEDD